MTQRFGLKPHLKSTVWHVSPLETRRQFKPFTHFGSFSAALDRAHSKSFRWSGETAWLYEVELDVKGVLRIDDHGGNHDIEALIAAVKESGHWPRKSAAGHIIFYE